MTRSRRRGRTQLAAASALFALLFAVSCGGGGDAGAIATTVVESVEVIEPANPDRIEPQLRDHIEHQLRAVRSNPADAREQAVLGIIYAANGMYLEAQACFRVVEHLEPGNPLPPYYQALVDREAGAPETALRGLQQLARRFPDFAPVQQRIGLMLLDAGDLDGAATAFERVIALVPSDPAGFTGLGETMLKRGEISDAIVQLEKSLRLAPDVRSTHYVLGLAYRALGQRKEAEQHLAAGRDAERIVMPDKWSGLMALHGMSVSQQIQRASSYLRQERLDEAVMTLETARAWHPGDTSIVNNLAIAYRRSGQPEQAIELLRAAQRAGESFSGLYLNLVSSLIDTGQLDEALIAAERAIEFDPDNAHGYLNKGDVLRRQGKIEASRGVLEQGLARDPENVPLHLVLGEVHLARGALDEAGRLYERAAQLAPLSWGAHARLCQIQLELGQPAAARRSLATAEALSPENPQLAELRQLVDELSGAEGR